MILLAGFAASEAGAATVLRTSGVWTSYNQPNADVTITGGPQLSQAHIRRANQASYHADVNIGTMAYPDVVEMRGSLTVTNIEPNFDTDIEFGYFDTTGGGVQFGFALGADTATTLNLWMVGDGARVQLPKVNLNETLVWEIVFDPAANLMTATVNGINGWMVAGANVYDTNAFGWLPAAPGTGSATGFVDLVMEGVEYSVGVDAPSLAEVPEPGAAGIAAATLLAGLLVLRSRRSAGR